jgi:hypothetical protein
MSKKLRYRLHWNSNREIPEFKWVIYDWKFKTPIAYTESRTFGRLVAWFYNINTHNKPHYNELNK